MKSTFALAALLASVAVAQPYNKHQHQHFARHQKRDETVVWITDYDYVTETVGVTTTIWVTEGYEPPTSSTSPPSTTTKSSTTLSTSTSQIPAQFFQPETQPATSSSTSTSVYVAPTPTPVYVAPTTPAAPVATPTTSTTPVYVAPAVVVEPSSSSPAAQVYTQAAAVPTAKETTTAAAAVPTVASSSSSSSSGTCSNGSPCAGDITFYDAGLGACGITSDGSTEKVVALPHGLMGTQSNGNPYCGKTITIKCSSTGKTTTATVVDKCMGCLDYAIDLSNAAFLDLDDLSVGRTTATWWFN